MRDASDTVDDPAGEASVPDLLVVLAENLKLHIAGSLMANACTARSA